MTKSELNQLIQYVIKDSTAELSSKISSTFEEGLSRIKDSDGSFDQNEAWTALLMDVLTESVTTSVKLTFRVLAELEFIELEE